MEFSPNISPIDVIKEGVFGGTYFRDIYSSVTGKFYEGSWKEFDELKYIDEKYHSSDFYDVRLNCYGVEVGTSLRFWESKGWIRPVDPYGCFQWYFRYWKKEEKVKMILGKLVDGKELLVDLLVF